MMVHIATTAAEREKIFQLRYRLLRAPWNQPYETSYDDLESASVNCYINDDAGNAIACGRLQQNPGRVGQIRYMAVDEKMQGAGLGKAVLKRLEDEARNLGLQKIELQARENALSFYKNAGYTTKEKTFLLFGVIQHYLMEKNI